ncbi:MAG TPA: PAS domain S-box protein [Syntrophales bacterium]|nr:PAS domain S-box protein [Syntrophales bacterium]
MGEGKKNGGQTIDERKDPCPQETAVSDKALSTGNTVQEFRIELFQQYRSTIDRANEAVFILQDSRFVFVNQKLAGLLGVPAEKLEGGSFPDFVWPVDRELIVTNYGKRLRREPVPDSYEFRIVGAGGRLTWVSLSATVLMRRGDRTAILYLINDITERRQAEEALRQSESRFRMLFENSGTAIIVVEDDTTISLANTEFEKLSGCPKGETEGKRNWTEFVVPEDRERMIEQHRLRREDAENASKYYEFRFSDAFGRVRDIALKADLIPGTTQTIASLLDITERRQAEKALKESEQRYRALMESTSAGIYLIQGNAFIYVNQAFEAITGYTLTELEGLPFWQFIHPDFREMVRGRGTRRLEGKEPSERYEFKIIRKDGREKWIELSAASIDLSDRPTIMGSMFDITDRKHAEEALRESEARFRDLSENAPDIIYTLDMTGAVTYANPAWKRILGHDVQELQGRYFTDFAREDDRRTYRKLFRGIRDKNRVVSNHIGAMLTRDGMERIFNMNSSFLRDADGRVIGVVGMMKDVTELLDMEKKLGQAQKMEAIGTLAGGIAHDFNNLLMGIQGYASLTLLDLEPSHPHYDRLKRIEEQVKSGTDLTKQLLGLARGGKYEVKPSDMNEILAGTSSLFGRTKKEISIYRNLAEDLRAVEVDRGQMEQVFMNLYVNAWQAMPAGGDIDLETANVVLGEEDTAPYDARPGRYVKIRVSDTGIGMDRKILERIFDPFFTTKAIGRGTGLGLAMVYGIVKGHGGIIQVDSRPGRGSTFTIYLPATEKAVVRSREESETIIGGHETILLVDDEQTVAEVTRELLVSLGYRVYVAGSGQDAIAVYMVKKEKIDLVILDMVMPGISGGETFDRLREINPAVRVILSSGYSINGQAQDIMDRGCSGFLQKPFRIEQLSAKVRAALD